MNSPVSADQQAANTDRVIYRTPNNSMYDDRILVTKGGGIGIDVGGHVIVKPLRDWFYAMKLQEQRGELSPDSPEGQFAAVFAQAEKGEPVNAQDLINALWWKIRNQRRELQKLNDQRQAEKLRG